MSAQLLNIFLHGIWAGSVLPFSNQNALFAAISFKADWMMSAIIAATTGNILGFALNWWVGCVLIHSILKRQPEIAGGYATLVQKTTNFSWIALAFVWIPLGNFLTLAAGVFRVKLPITLAISGIAMAIYYHYAAFF